MSNLSTIVEWLNENGNRAYPLTEDNNRYVTKINTTIDLYELVLDAALFYETLPDSVTLDMIVTTSTDLSIYVAGQLTFTITNYATASYPNYVRNINNSLLVIGDATSIPANMIFNIGAVFEPCVATEIYPATKGVTSVSIKRHILTGNISLSDGYQLSLLPSTNAINIEVGRNEGHPLPCIPILGTINDCNLATSFINGASPTTSGGIVKFEAGSHIKIFDDIDNNRVYIGYDFVESDVPANVAKVTRPIAIV